MLVPQALTHKSFQNHKSVAASKTTESLTRRTLIQIALSVTVVIVASTAISYSHIMSSLKSQTLGQLKNYVLERGQREASIFALAEDNHAVLKQELVRQLQTSTNSDPIARFDQLLTRSPDGVIRNRPDSFDSKRQAGVFIDKSLPINADIRRRVISFYDLLNAYGAAWHNRFQDTYIMTPENIMVVYWPGFTWAQEVGADLDIPKEEYYFVADQKHNPARKTAWTGLYYEGVSQRWMVSGVTPIDINGEQVAAIGHDVMLNDLMERTVNEHLEGGYNLIFREDGRLIAHPKLMDQLQKQKGLFNILDSDDAHLKNIFASVKNKSAGQVLIENAQNAEYLAVTKLDGPDWYFVTVLPKAILTQQAIAIARFTLLLGFCSLLVVIAVVFWVLQRRIALPLEQLTSATNRIASGDFQVALDDSRQDELGRLAHAFNTMAQEVAARTADLQNTLERQSLSVTETTATMDELNISSRQSAEQAEAAAMGAHQVLTLIDGDGQEQTVGTTLSLRAKVGQIAKQILHLSDQTTQINVVSKLVSDLANQTNMLALNAAVEAARAGENGKGFAVVAAEIRKLADQSRESAEQITRLVLEIQKSTKATVMVSDEGRKTVDAIVTSINTITLNSQQISLTAKQQAIAVQQVLDAMNALSQGGVQAAYVTDGKRLSG